jgi:hypothetical protein
MTDSTDDATQHWTVTFGEAATMRDAIREAFSAGTRGAPRACHPTLLDHDGSFDGQVQSQRPDTITWAVPRIPPCPLGAVSVPDLIAKMWELKRWAADPGFHTLERRAERIERRAGTCRALPHSTLHRAMTRQHMPRLEQLELFVRACGAEAHWYEWQRAWRAVDANIKSRGKPRHRGR